MHKLHVLDPYLLLIPKFGFLDFAFANDTSQFLWQADFLLGSTNKHEEESTQHKEWRRLNISKLLSVFL